MLTTAQKKRLAREAEKLAMECVEGTSPAFTPDSYCGCAIGTLIKRALPALWREDYRGSDPFYQLAVEIDRHFQEDHGTLGMVSRSIQYSHNPELLAELLPDARATVMRDSAVFPLLALADALEESARK